MYYGWYIVFASVVLMTCNSAIGIYGFTAFIDPIAASFGWSYLHISLASSLRGIETGVLNPFMGILVDRYPAKRLALIAIVLYAFGLLCLSRITGLAMFYISFLIIGLGGSLGFSMVPQTTVARWFKKDIGKATGVLFMGNGLGGVFVPVIVYMIDAFSWRGTLIILGIGFLVFGPPLSFVYRSRPEDEGLLPDGEKADTTHGVPCPNTASSGKRVSEALRMRAFWQIGIGTFCQAIAMSAVITHIMPYLQSIGIERTLGGLAAMGVPLVSLTSRIPFGWLSDYYDKRYMRAVSIGLVAAGLFLLSLVRDASIGWIVLFVLFMGLGTGGMMPTLLPIYRAYFGQRHFGKIFGLTNIFFTIGVVTGPTLGGWGYDVMGEYGPIWLILGGTALFGGILSLMAPPPPKFH